MKTEIAEAAERGKKVNRQIIKALVIPLTKREEADTPGQSKAMVDDPWQTLEAAGRIIDPPFDPLVLSMLPELNSEMEPAIEAMETNIEGFGHRLISTVENDASEEVKKAAHQEKVRLTNFFAYASLDYSYKQLRKMRRRDYEVTGNAYWEVIRNAAGQVQGFTHMPSYQMRIGLADLDPLDVEVPIMELQLDGSLKVVKVQAWRRFRRYAQSKSGRLRWFREFGDPRILDNETGEFVDGELAAKLPEHRRANELIHWAHYTGRSVYGLPRFTGCLLSIYGDREAESINYATFRNNNIPSMVVLVSNGQLTAGSIERIKEFAESKQQSDNYSKFLILEAEGEFEGEDAAQAKISIQPLTESQARDAMFLKYSAGNRDKIRRAWRLPPLHVGRADDFSRATAETSRKVADEQIFAPEREDLDDWINLRLFPEMGVVYHHFRSNTPNTTDNTELTRILGGAERTGGMTPRIARLMLEDILGMELPPFPDDFPQDLPFSLTMAEAVKNLGDPSQVGQTVTALKTMEQLTGDSGLEADDEAAVERLERLSRKLEERWRTQVGEEQEQE